MRTIYALVACAVVAGAAIGCGDDTSSGAGGSGGSNTGGTTNNTGGTTNNTGGTTNNTGGSAPNCDGLTGGTDVCSLCVEGSCCPELDACLNDAACGACAADPAGAGCDTDPLLTDLSTCLQGSCATECAPMNACNPITNEGCDSAAGQACDFSDAGLACFDPPNDAALCAACDQMNGPFCQAGSTCALNNQCTKFCCTDADCGTGKCDLTLTGDTYGLCTLMNDAMMPSCDAPAMAPSNGTCFTL